MYFCLVRPSYNELTENKWYYRAYSVSLKGRTCCLHGAAADQDTTDPRTPLVPQGNKKVCSFFNQSVYSWRSTEPRTNLFPFRSLSVLFLVYLMHQSLLQVTFLVTHTYSGYNRFLALLCVSCVLSCTSLSQSDFELLRV